MLDLSKTQNLQGKKERNRDIDQVAAKLKVIYRPKYKELVFVAKKSDTDILSFIVNIWWNNELGLLLECEHSWQYHVTEWTRSNLYSATIPLVTDHCFLIVCRILPDTIKIVTSPLVVFICIHPFLTSTSYRTPFPLSWLVPNRPLVRVQEARPHENS